MPARSARSRMMRRPTWLAPASARGSKPRPSSAISKRHSGRLDDVDADVPAPACLRTFDSASCTMCSTCTCTSAGSGTPWPSIRSWVGHAALVLEFLQRGAQGLADVAGRRPRAEVQQQLAHVAVALAHAGVDLGERALRTGSVGTPERALQQRDLDLQERERLGDRVVQFLRQQRALAGDRGFLLGGGGAQALHAAGEVASPASRAGRAPRRRADRRAR